MNNFRDQLRPRFSQREAVVQRVGWFVLALIPIAAIVGLLGGGIYSDRTVTVRNNGESVSLTYERWGRMHSSLELRFRVDAPGRQADAVSLNLSYGFMEEVEISGVVPEPHSTSISPSGAVMQWQVDGWDEPFSLTVHYIANKWATLDGEIEVEAGSEPLARFEVSQFLFP